MKKMKLMLVIVMFAGSVAFADDPTVAEVTHTELQAVNGDGIGTYDDSDKVIITGIILNNPEEMLDPTPGAPAYLGGQWQIYIQGDGNDHAGTAVYLGQYYARVGGGSGSYTDEQLLSELCSINRDPNTGYTFAAGDRVKVIGWYKFYKGKLNVNEMHETTPTYDFEIELLEPAVGLPQPEVISLDKVKDGNDNFIFDQTRQTGCEHYQARLVRIKDVNFISGTWGPYETMVIEDANGLTFDVLLGIGAGFSKPNNLTAPFDVIAIFDQESSSNEICQDGYRLWVTNYDGNGLVLTDRGHKRGNLPGDINTNYIVDFEDLAELAANWLKNRAGLYDCGQ